MAHGKARVEKFLLGKIIVKTPGPAPIQAGLQADEPPSGVLQVPPGPPAVSQFHRC